MLAGEIDPAMAKPDCGLPRARSRPLPASPVRSDFFVEPGAPSAIRPWVRDTRRTSVTELHWLPAIPDWRQRLRALPGDPATAWDNAVALANARLNFVLTNALDETIRRVLPAGPETLATKKVRLAVLGSSTLTHLLPAIRVAGLRRGIWIDTYENDYGQYLQELSDTDSALHAFQPDGDPARAGRVSHDGRRHRRDGCARRRRRAAGNDRAASRRPGAWRARRSAARSSSRPSCRCICQFSAATSTACPARAPGS